MKKLITKITLLLSIYVICIGTSYAYNIEVKPGRISSMPNSDIAFRIYVSDNDIVKKSEQNVWNYSKDKINIKVAGKLSVNEMYFHMLPNTDYKYDSKVDNYGYVNYLSTINEKENKASEITKLPLTTLTSLKTENIYRITSNDGLTEYRYRNEDGSIYAVDYVIAYNKYLEILNKAAYDRDAIYFTMPLSMQNRVYETASELYQSAIEAENLKGDSDKNITSGINYYDNLMYLPTFTNRHIYIRHIDATDPINNNVTLTAEAVEKLPRLLGNQNIAVSETRNVVSAIKNETGYQEVYDIASISNASVNYSNNSNYNYLGYTMSKSTSREESEKDIENQIKYNVLQNLNDDKKVNIESSNVDDYIFIDFYYKRKEGIDSTEEMKNIQGRLSFEALNNGLIKKEAEVGKYVPSGSQLSAGFTDADIYKIGGLNYEENSNKLNIEVTVSKEYNTKDNPNTTKTKTEKFKYTINYSLYKLNNFKLYRISKLELYDSAKNIGGKLFENAEDMTTIEVSSNFKDRFSNFSTEVNENNIQVKMNQNLYNIKANTKDTVKLEYKIPVGTVENDEKVLAPTSADVPQIQAIFKNDTLIVNGQPLLDGSSSVVTIDNGFLDKTTVTLPGFDTWSYYSAKEVRPKTTISDFDSTPVIIKKEGKKDKKEALHIAELLENGLRKVTGKVYYELIKDETYGRNSLNIGSNDFTDSITGKKSPTEVFSKEIADTADEDNVDDIIVQTPIVVSATLNQDSATWHYEEERPAQIIQKTGKISVKISHKGDHGIYGPIETSSYVVTDFVKFDFDVVATVNMLNYKKGEFISAGSFIKVQAGSNVSVALPDKEFNKILNIDNNNVEIKSITLNYRDKPFNIGDALIQNTLLSAYEEEGQNGNIYDSKYQNSTFKESNYVVYTKLNLAVANRIYDFKVTNIKDSVYSSLFTNGFAFYSGYTEYTPYSADKSLVNRNIDSKQVLPIGPTSLIGSRESTSPEIGSKISFDLKTTGKFGYLSDESLRHIEIEPEYYYVDDEGKELYKEGSIKLYYKNDSGKYVELGGKDDTFRIKMIPRDGVRTNKEVENGFNISNMTPYELEIGNYKKLTLGKSCMAVGQNDFIQVWYGDFYLPESTIVVAGNVKNPKEKSALKSGYLMVKFNIKSIEKDGRVLSYQSDLSGKNNTTNQWSIEDYASAFILNNNKKYSITKDTLKNSLTGTVLIYDLSK